MPRENAGDAPAATNNGANENNNGTNAPAPRDLPISSILEHAGVPEAIRSQLATEPKADAAHDAQTTEGDESGKQESGNDSEPDEVSAEGEAEADGAGDEQADDDEGAGEGADEQQQTDPKDRTIRRLQRRIDKLTARQNGKHADEDGAADEDKSAAVTDPVSLNPGSDVLGDVANAEQLQRKVMDARALRRWCIANPDGTVLNGGTDAEQTIAPETVRDWLLKAEDVLEAGPAKQQELLSRQKFDSVAHVEYPGLFQKGSAEYQDAQEVYRAMPFLRTHPGRNFIVGVMLEGYAARNARIGSSHDNGNGERDTNGHNAARSNLPEPLRRKQPPLVRTPAAKPPQSSRTPQITKSVDAAKQRAVKSGGAIEDIVNLIKTKRALRGLTPSGRTAVPV